MRDYQLLIITSFIFLLSACGQSGGLYLPENSPTPTTQQQGQA